MVPVLAHDALRQKTRTLAADGRADKGSLTGSADRLDQRIRRGQAVGGDRGQAAP
jgi:hypothetical protein